MLELFGSSGCPYTQEMREWLEFSRRDFVEFDVETDAAALARMRRSHGPAHRAGAARRRQGCPDWLAGTRMCRGLRGSHA